MGLSEHPSTEVLSAYLRGATSPGVALAVEAHTELCETCRSEAGAAYPSLPDVEAVLPKAREGVDVMDDLPARRQRSAALGRVRPGPWRRIARGVRRSPLRSACGLGEAVFLLNASAGAPLELPAAAHLVVVLRGAVRGADRVYARGDFIESAGIRLQGAGGDEVTGCLCLVVGDDDLYGTSLLGLLKGATRSLVRSQD
jgi:anti-sigma factor ChrR (cupin superfamily)